MRINTIQIVLAKSTAITFLISMSMPFLAGAQSTMQSLPPTSTATQETTTSISTPPTPPPPFQQQDSINNPGNPPEQQISKREIFDFTNEFNNLTKEAKMMLKQMGKSQNVDEQRKALTDIITAAGECVSNMQKASLEDKRDIMQDCRNKGLWDTMNEIRDEFVPPQELNNARSDIKRQTQDLNRMKKQAIKGGDTSTVQAIDTLINQLNDYKGKFDSLSGRDLRDEIHDYWDARLGDEMNKIRARVELPKQMKDILKDLKIVQKSVKTASYQKVFQSMGIDEAKLQEHLAEKQATIDQINTLMTQGSFDEAFDLVQEDIYQDWHPGDLRNFIDMIRETYERFKQVRDKSVKDQVLEVLQPIVEGFNAGEYRSAREAMMQFSEQMHRFENLFQRDFRGRGLDAKTTKSLEKLQLLIEQKLGGETKQEGNGQGENQNQSEQESQGEQQSGMDAVTRGDLGAGLGFR